MSNNVAYKIEELINRLLTRILDTMEDGSPIKEKYFESFSNINEVSIPSMIMAICIYPTRVFLTESENIKNDTEITALIAAYNSLISRN